MSQGVYQSVSLAGARIAYRSAGAGAAIVLIKNNRRPLDLPTAEVLSERFRVLQIQPVGFGASDRPEEYAFGSIDAQVLAVLDHEGVDRFVVWGFSQTGFMAAMVARATERAAALIVGSVSLIGMPTDATMRRLEREPRLPRASLEFWRASRRFDWHHELRVLSRSALFYIGTADPGWRRLRKLGPVLEGCGCDVQVFPDLDHQSAGLGGTGHGLATTVSAITGWLGQRLPTGW